MPPFVFFGSSQISIFALEALKKRGVLPIAIVTTEDRPSGRGLKMTENMVKTWAKENNIEVTETPKADLFLVVSYGKIIPKSILDIPKDGVLNLHPSLLPKYRGPSPIPSAILDDEKNTGVSIMKLDAEMDHGPILVQEKVDIKEWSTLFELKKIMAEKGADLLLKNYENTPVEQDHSQASYTKKFTKKDGLLDPKDDPYLNYRKYCAFTPWPSVYYFLNGKRIKITKAKFENGKFIIEKIIPEGKAEMDFTESYLFENSQK